MRKEIIMTVFSRNGGLFAGKRSSGQKKNEGPEEIEIVEKSSSVLATGPLKNSYFRLED